MLVPGLFQTDSQTSTYAGAPAVANANIGKVVEKSVSMIHIVNVIQDHIPSEMLDTAEVA